MRSRRTSTPSQRPREPHCLLVDVQLLRKTRKLTPPDLLAVAAPEHPVVLRQGNRLSITPVEPEHWRRLVKLLGAAAG